jgi:hypothetical protein
VRSPRFRSTLAVALAVCCAGPVAAQESVAEGRPGIPTRAEVREAIDRVAKDPNLATERTAPTLRWVRNDEAQRDVPGWLQSLLSLARFVRGLFGWVASSARALLWVAAAILAAVLAVFLLRLVRSLRRGPRLPKGFVAPSHVRDLDIRPESLPDDVGAAAAELWDRGEQRAALALLYRALLSRLVHGYNVPIQVSSTEGDCLALAAPRLSGTASGYTTRLVGVWQNAVYGGLSPTAAAVHALCAEFSPVFDAVATPRGPT